MYPLKIIQTADIDDFVDAKSDSTGVEAANDAIAPTGVESMAR